MKRTVAALAALALAGCAEPPSPPAVVEMNSASVTVGFTVPEDFWGAPLPLTATQETAMEVEAARACRAQGRTAGAPLSSFTRCIAWREGATSCHRVAWSNRITCTPGGRTCVRYALNRLYPCKG